MSSDDAVDADGRGQELGWGVVGGFRDSYTLNNGRDIHSRD